MRRRTSCTRRRCRRTGRAGCSSGAGQLMAGEPHSVMAGSRCRNNTLLQIAGILSAVETDTEVQSDRSGRAVVDGVFRLLEGLAAGQGPMGLSEVARRAGLPKATAHRLLGQLAAVGAVERVADRYAIGPLVARLGLSWQSYPGLRAAAEPVTRRAAVAASSIAGLSELHPGGPERLVMRLGSIGDLPQVQASRTLPSNTASGLLLRAFNPGTPAPDFLSAREWNRQRSSIADRGVAVAEHIGPVDIRCVAAPVRAPDGRLVAAFFLIVPSSRPVGTRLTEMVRLAGQRISAAL
ncbi:helix-turn-helix domain-containing protein [Streptomyces sp. NPDC005408]|uniref:IclR family transcriptional regulator n=1 Tax=Streptomyces sp. NPDC005408 TaxID=3155341 RepID=UPI0033BE787E